MAITFSGAILGCALLILGLSSAPRHLTAAIAASAPRIEERQIPLPPGDWREVARDAADGGRLDTGIVMMRLNGRDVDAAVLARVNRLGHVVTWGLPSACLSAEYAPRRVAYVSDHDGFCAYAAFADGTGPLGSVAIDPVWRRAMQVAVDRGWNVPSTWLSVTFRVVDPMDAMQIRYLFHSWPVEQGRPPESAAWRRIQSDRLAVWMQAAEPVVGRGFRDRLRTRQDSQLPDPDRMADTTRTDGTPSGSDASAAPASMKGLSARVAAMLADFGVLWAFLGNPVTASAIAGAKFAAQGATGVTHEMVWSWVAPSSTAADLPGVGVEMPLPR